MREDIQAKIKVNFFQRKPRVGFSFSLEYIFQDIRRRLENKIASKVYISRCYNDGYSTKFVNIFDACFRQQNDINHITGELHFLNLLMRKKRVLLTIHDCGMMERKKGLSKRIVKWLYLTMPVSKALYITAVSEETKKQIINYTNCNPNKIRVIPVGVDSLYQPSPKKFNQRNTRILHIGTGYNKNLLRLIEAVKSIPCHLIIIGKLSGEHLELLKLNNVDYSNEYNISPERMLNKFEECDILAFVSTFEGFGMPIIEANSVERVVLTSNISSMPEIAGEAACLVNPFNVEDIRSGIIKLINDDVYREELIQKGRINKLRFDPQTIADSYYELYKKIKES